MEIEYVRNHLAFCRATPGKLVDSNPEIEKELKTEMDRIVKIYGGAANVDMTKFPNFNFQGTFLMFCDMNLKLINSHSVLFSVPHRSTTRPHQPVDAAVENLDGVCKYYIIEQRSSSSSSSAMSRVVNVVA
jgi:hypothetical protein